MSAKACNKRYDLCEDFSGVEGVEAPLCPHGPTLLFSRSDSEGQVIEKFYACAACRSRKDCSFYQEFGKRGVLEKVELRKQIYEQHNAHSKHFSTCIDGSDTPVMFCMSCDVVIPNELCKDKSHQHRKLSCEDIKFPSHWITAKESNKTNAQYFFSAEVIELISSVITDHRVDKVLCIGTPSVHEQLKHGSTSVCSLLLDLDVRMRQFHKDFAHYNMFNHHFFQPEEFEQFRQFTRGGSHLLVLIDPPYGGLLAALRNTLDKISAAVQGKVTTLLFLPYFMEPQVSKQLPSLTMTDYKVNYTNHSGYRAATESKTRGSAARVFTNIPLNDLVLPQSEGYRYCEECSRYISRENKHCNKCGSCTTKDGPTYRHCNVCERCVKPSWTHCDECNRCELKGHICGQAITSPGTPANTGSSQALKRSKMSANSRKWSKRNK